MRARCVVLGLLSVGLVFGCGQGERERGELYLDPALQADPLPVREPELTKTYAKHLADVPSGASEQETLEALL
jgi:hypothetical protein